jgi:hypothetical protein
MEKSIKFLILTIISFIVGVCFIKASFDEYSKTKNRIEKLVEKYGIYDALNEMPYFVSDRILADNDSEESIRKVVIKSYIQADKDYNFYTFFYTFGILARFVFFMFSVLKTTGKGREFLLKKN